MAYSGDPFRDFDRYDERLQGALDRRPCCCECGERIQDDTFYELDDGRYVCPECLDENHKKWTDDYTE